MESESQPQRMIAYTRVSTDEQAMSGLGLEAQASTLQRAFEYRGWDLVELVREEGITGSTLNRPGLRHALERVVAGDVDGLVVSKLDRLTRSMRDFCEIVDWFEEAGAPLVMLEPDVDTSTPAGRAVAHVMVAFAEMERGMIGDRTRVALAAKRARGEATGRPAIADHPELMQRFLELHAPDEHGQRKTLSEVARILTAEGWPTVRGGTQWRASALQQIAGYERPPARRRRAELPDIPRRRRRTR
jgi:DNA invertase Pin-like site-specific DNA recombinase